MNFTVPTWPVSLRPNDVVLMIQGMHKPAPPQLDQLVQGN
jgi:hypothetical protein